MKTLQLPLKLNKKILTFLFTSSLVACGGGGGGGGGGDTTSSSSGGTSTTSSSSTSSSGSSTGSSSGGPSDNVSVGGTISGISAGQLKISNAGDDLTSVDEDGNFSFSVPKGSNYEILIEANPLEQLCSVENGQASDVENAISNITITCEPIAAASGCSGFADSDEDGLTDCQELDSYHTHPWLDDTDGDGFADGREVIDYDPSNNRFVFNPLVADMANIAVDLTAVPEIDMNFSESTGGSSTVSTSYEQSESESISNEWGGETSRQLEMGHTLSVETTQTVGTEVNVSLTDIGASASYESSLTLGFESSVSQTRGSSVNWSNSAASENARAYSESVELTEEQSNTYDGGFLRVTARVRNDGHIPYDLENLTLSAVLFDPLRPFDIQSIGTMEFSDGGFPRTTILSGESAPLNFSTNLTLGKAQQLLRDSDNIVVMPGTYRLLDINDQSILLVDQDVSARTATVIIDYGIHAAREDKFRVAVNNGGGQRSISILSALQDVLGLNVSQGAGEWIFGNDSSASATPSGLIELNSYAMDTNTNRYWLLAHNHNDDQNSGQRVTDYYNIIQEGYDLSAINLRAGDKLTLVYVGDDDRDGLSDRMEIELGTNRTLLDTDNDTLGDGLEVYGWLSNLNSAPCNEGENLVRVYSNPLKMDSDDDTIDDATEKENCENPNFNFVSEAGEDQFVNTASPVTLYGSIDGITQGAPVYQWNLLSGPDVLNDQGQSTRMLEGRQPTFTAPAEVSTLVWELSATVDGETQTDETKVQVQLDRNLSVYVGNMAEGVAANGSIEAPYGTISEALSSLMPGDDLYVMSKAEPYNLVNTLEIPDGTSMFGGYDENWVRNTSTNATVINFVTSLENPAVRITDISDPMWFSGFSLYVDGTSGPTSNNVIAIDVASSTSSEALYIVENRIESSDVAPGTSAEPGSSYALRVNSLSTLRLLNNTLIAGQGGTGSNGAAGTNGTDGNDASGRSRGAGGPGINGANGGVAGSGGLIPGGGNNGGTGDGTGGAGTGGTRGTALGSCENATGTGGHGNNGTAATSGSAGSQPNYMDYVFEYGFGKGGDGTNGGHGEGGGGGASGGGCGTADGGYGGGGGEGGTGGTRGFGGANGGASIALWLNDVTNVELRNNHIEATLGGNAGSGGNGGAASDGGSYASGGAAEEVCVTIIVTVCDRGGAGARGGNGGDGARGGDGGGGAGGASFGIFVAPNVAPLLFDNTIYGGIAGNGGYSRTNGGRGGDSYAIYDADTSDGALPELVSGNVLEAGVAGFGGSTSVGSAGSAGDASEVNYSM